MVSFKVKSLFYSVPLRKTIDLTIEVKKKKITKSVTKELLKFCTRIMHFAFVDFTYLQNDGVAVGLSLSHIGLF